MVAGPSSRPKSRRSDPCCMSYGLRDPCSRARRFRSYMPARLRTCARSCSALAPRAARVHAQAALKWRALYTTRVEEPRCRPHEAAARRRELAPAASPLSCKAGGPQVVFVYCPRQRGVIPPRLPTPVPLGLRSSGAQELRRCEVRETNEQLTGCPFSTSVACRYVACR